MRIRDLYCGAGGAAEGLHQAFPHAEIVGVDIVPQPHYPFTLELGDALDCDLDGYDLIWASPPCQGYSVMRNLPWNRDKQYPLLIEATRDWLKAQKAPWIIENVMGAQRKAQMGANWLCGTMFGRPYYRHRVFETSFFWLMPLHPTHPKHHMVPRSASGIGPGGGGARSIVFTATRHPGQQWWGKEVTKTNTLSHASVRMAAAAREAMEIDWMTADELSQAVPPVYSRYLAQWVPL